MARAAGPGELLEGDRADEGAEVAVGVAGRCRIGPDRADQVGDDRIRGRDRRDRGGQGCARRPGQRRPAGRPGREPCGGEVDPVAAHGHALAAEQLELDGALRDAAVGAHDAVPGDVVRPGEHAPDRARRRRVDVGVGADEPRGDLPHPRDDAVGEAPGVRHGGDRAGAGGQSSVSDDRSSSASP